jgi:hypothetical protein
MHRTKLDAIDQIANAVGDPLRREEISISFFGDSIIEEETRPDTDMRDDDRQIANAIGDFRRAIEAFPIEENWRTEFREIKPPLELDQEYPLDYFIDGCIRTKYLGELIMPQVAQKLKEIEEILESDQ